MPEELLTSRRLGNRELVGESIRGSTKMVEDAERKDEESEKETGAVCSVCNL